MDETGSSRSELCTAVATFLRNHREAITAMDFFTVPTITFGVLYGFFVIGHDRRHVLHFNVTRHPTSAWIVQQLRETFPYEPPATFLLLDHDSKYGAEVFDSIRAMNIEPVRTSVGCPWQNGVAERWVGSCRRELLDHVVAINESHLKRLLAAYVEYYHQDRTHCGLQKQTPTGDCLVLNEAQSLRGLVSEVFIIAMSALPSLVEAADSWLGNHMYALCLPLLPRSIVIHAIFV